ncbi:MAG: 3-methyl-2-oxobutanoate hydroxymethyltransferase [Coriobacteriales bacterium]|jgi:3-methyl-2-oxobutanoate hydroxymethyltransferase|nr:3-methyl-2-oxobutanoate hydroxymethyltransferase [Coriobacteriales bacterium]
MKTTVLTLKAQKQNGDKITMLTAYDYSTALLMDEADIDCLLVGDSLGMVMLGYENTLAVTVEDIIYHTRAVARAAKHAMVIADMPFLSYQVNVEDAVRNAGRFLKEANAHAVKLEGGREVCPQIRAITDATIPVVAHLGLTPQSVNALGGFKVQGRDATAAYRLLHDALAVEEAGAFAVVLECVPADLATWITGKLSIPTIGIGAGAGCDGQVLVYQDMLGLYGGTPAKFVKQFANAGELMRQGFSSYIEEVKNGAFPAQEHCYKIEPEALAEAKRMAGE